MKFAVLCSKMQMLLCVNVQNMVVYDGNCLFFFFAGL